MEENDDKVEIIPEKDRIQEIEEQVEFYMSTTPDLPKNTLLPERINIPEFKNNSEKIKWQKREINRCKKGYKNMSGKMYFFYNYCHIRNLGTGGKIRPEFRVCDNEWFNAVTEAQESRKWGIVCVKRRRVGASWKEAADVVQDLMFNKFYHVGMNSKTENDSIHLFRKVMFIYENLPAFMKAAIGSKNGMKVEFFVAGKDEHGNKIRKGNQCELTVVAPTDSAYEGLMLHKWICDEAGKISNLGQMWSYTEDCLMQETKRFGVPILFGTSGDITKDGMGLMEKWDNSELYRLRRFFFSGWMGLAVDKYGNDRKEDAIRWILYERKRREKLSKKDYIDFIQRYPLTPEEAFSKFSGSGLGDPVTLNRHLTDLRKNPPFQKKGYFRFDEDWNVRFIPDPFGPIILYEDPDKNPNTRYIGGIDPADHDDVTDEASDLSTHIFRESDGIMPHYIVAEYVDRPKKLSDYYNQAICLSLFYNKARYLIEDNRYRMIDHLQEKGFKHLLYHSPPAVNRLFKTKPNKVGIRMTPDVKEYMEGVINDYLEYYTEEIPSVELIKEIMEYGSRNTDRVMSFGIGIILARSRRGISKRARVGKVRTPSYEYRADSKGRIVRIGSPLGELGSRDTE